MHRRFELTHFLIGVLAWVGIGQFAGCVFVAVRMYPGQAASSRVEYQLSQNFLSDLGCTQTATGRNNTEVAGIFNRSVVALGLAMIPFLLLLPADWEQGRTIMQIAGVSSAVGLIGIGLTPYDRYFIAHHVALGLWLLPLFLIVVAYFVAYLHRGEASPWLGAGTIVLLAAMAGYALAGSHSGYVVFQKVMALCALAWFAAVFARVGVIMVQSLPSRRRRLVEQQARHYLANLSHGYRRKPG